MVSCLYTVSYTHLDHTIIATDNTDAAVFFNNCFLIKKLLPYICLLYTSIFVDFCQKTMNIYYLFSIHHYVYIVSVFALVLSAVCAKSDFVY